jgi:hypothetical protein
LTLQAGKPKALQLLVPHYTKEFKTTLTVQCFRFASLERQGYVSIVIYGIENFSTGPRIGQQRPQKILYAVDNDGYIPLTLQAGKPKALQLLVPHYTKELDYKL